MNLDIKHKTQFIVYNLYTSKCSLFNIYNILHCTQDKNILKILIFKGYPLLVEPRCMLKCFFDYAIEL